MRNILFYTLLISISVFVGDRLGRHAVERHIYYTKLKCNKTWKYEIMIDNPYKIMYNCLMEEL